MAVRGSKKHTDRLRRMSSAQAAQTIARGLYAAGQEIEIEAEHLITQGSISGPGHIPSLPGEPPNADTRDLDSKIDTTLVAQGLNPTVHVTAWSDHAVPLEFGTSKMAERPYMRPATARKRARAQQLVRGAVQVTIR